MTMYDNTAKIMIGIQKRAANPHQIVESLAFPCHTGTYASVGKTISPLFVVEL